MRASEVVIPGRKGAPVDGAPKGAQLFKAFQTVRPADVRAIILGQDPYPKPTWATGRAFEQGNLTAWPQNAKLVADSLRRIVQAIAAARTGRKAYVANDRAWETVMRDYGTGDLKLEPPPRLFSRLEKEGVLFLNTSLTISTVLDTKGHTQIRSHLRLWEPFTSQVLRFLASRKTGHVVLLLLGQKAFDIFQRARIRATAERTGNVADKN